VSSSSPSLRPFAPSSTPPKSAPQDPLTPVMPHVPFVTPADSRPDFAHETAGREVRFLKATKVLKRVATLMTINFPDGKESLNNQEANNGHSAPSNV
jgi:hypothetical protein